MFILDVDQQLWSISKPNKDHTDPLSYRPNTLLICLCKILECMINTRFICYLEKKSGIIGKRQCRSTKHRTTIDQQVSPERYVRVAFAWKPLVVIFFFDLDKAYETTWQYGILQDLHRVDIRG